MTLKATMWDTELKAIKGGCDRGDQHIAVCPGGWTRLELQLARVSIAPQIEQKKTIVRASQTHERVQPVHQRGRLDALRVEERQFAAACMSPLQTHRRRWHSARASIQVDNRRVARQHGGTEGALGGLE